jgi:hypothetical protein
MRQNIFSKKMGFVLLVGLGLLGLILFAVMSQGFFLAQTKDREAPFPDSGVLPLSSPTPSGIWVNISGAVKSPGLYQLPAESRTLEVLRIAGGLVKNADFSYVNQSLNLAEKLKDSQKVYIPFLGEHVSIPTTQKVSSKASSTTSKLKKKST